MNNAAYLESNIEGQTGMSLTLLLETLNSDFTKTSYTRFMKRFQKFVGKEFDEIILTNPVELTRIIQAYIIETKKYVNPNSIPGLIAPIRSFLEVNDVILNWRKIVRFYPRKTKVTGASAWSTEEIQRMLATTKTTQSKLIIYMLASTGCRIGGLENLQLKDIRDVDYGCKMVTFYADDIEEYFSFLTPEASYYLEMHLKERKMKGENITQTSPIFVPSRRVLQRTYLDRGAMRAVVYRAVNNAKLRAIPKTQLPNKRHTTQVCHGFRKRFNTIMKDAVDKGVAVEKMMGHYSKEFKHDTVYYQSDNLLDAFVQGIPDLTISDEQRLRFENNQLKKESKSNTTEIAKQVQKYLNDKGGDFSLNNNGSFKNTGANNIHV